MYNHEFRVRGTTKTKPRLFNRSYIIVPVPLTVQNPIDYFDITHLTKNKDHNLITDLSYVRKRKTRKEDSFPIYF